MDGSTEAENSAMDKVGKYWMDCITFVDPTLNQLTVMEEHDLIEWLCDAKEQDENDKERKTTKMELINRVGKRIPVGSFGGLSQAYRKLMTNGKVVMGMFQFLRIALNMRTILAAFYIVVDEEMVIVNDPEADVYTTLSATGMRVCIDYEQTDCIFHPMHRLNAYKACAVIEVVIVIFLTVCYLPLILSYVSCNDKLPGERPWFFIFAPRLASGFSSLVFLSFISLKTYLAFTFYDEGQMWFEVIKCSLLPNRKYSKETRGSWRSHPCIWAALLLVNFVLFALSFQSLLVKMSLVHWAATMDFKDWPRQFWIDMIGYVNQVSYALDIWSADISCMLRFVFAGVEHAFTPKSSKTIAAYLSMICEDLTAQTAEKGSWRFACCMVMSYLQADDFQTLLVSQRKDVRYTSEVEEKRLEVIQQTLMSDDAIRFKEQLHDARVSLDRGEFSLREANFQLQTARERYIASLKKHRDALMKDAQLPKVLRSIGKSQLLLLAAEVQNWIEDVEGVDFFENVTSTTQDQEYEEDVEYETDDDEWTLFFPRSSSRSSNGCC